MAKLLVDQLAKANTEQQIYKMLQPPSELSKAQSLEQLYALNLRQISKQAGSDAKLGKRVLKELLAAHEPMTAAGLLDAVAEDIGWDETDDQNRIEERVNRCVRCCMSLVVQHERKVIQFAHLTVLEFLKVHGIPD